MAISVFRTVGQPNESTLVTLEWRKSQFLEWERQLRATKSDANMEMLFAELLFQKFMIFSTKRFVFEIFVLKMRLLKMHSHFPQLLSNFRSQSFNFQKSISFNMQIQINLLQPNGNGIQ